VNQWTVRKRAAFVIGICFEFPRAIAIVFDKDKPAKIKFMPVGTIWRPEIPVLIWISFKIHAAYFSKRYCRNLGSIAPSLLLMYCHASFHVEQGRVQDCHHLRARERRSERSILPQSNPEKRRRLSSGSSEGVEDMMIFVLRMLAPVYVLPGGQAVIVIKEGGEAMCRIGSGGPWVRLTNLCVLVSIKDASQSIYLIVAVKDNLSDRFAFGYCDA